MAFRVSVRNLRELEQRLRAGYPFEIPRECRRNSDVVYTIMQEAHRVVPGYRTLSAQERTMVADSVAYALRPDITVSSREGIIGIFLVSEEKHALQQYDPNQPIRFRNDPNELHVGWEIPKEFDSRIIGREFTRCYSCALTWIPGLFDKVRRDREGDIGLAITFAEITVFLLTPEDLTQYNYQPGEVDAFHTHLKQQMKLV